MDQPHWGDSSPAGGYEAYSSPAGHAQAPLGCAQAPLGEALAPLGKAQAPMDQIKPH